MHTENEQHEPKLETLNLVESCIDNIKADKAGLVEWFDTYALYHKKRIAFDIDIILNNLSPQTSVLEFGSVPLLFTSALKKSGYNVHGIDIAPERFASSIKQLELTVLKCDIENEKLPINDNTYDAVVFNELFEHLRINPIFTMSEVLRVLKPGGVLFLSSPNLRSFDGIINFLFKKQAYSCSGGIYNEYEKLEKLGHMGHVREYTSTEVIQFLRKIGFIGEKIIYRGKLSSKTGNFIAKIHPSFRPFISYVFRKPGS